MPDPTSALDPSASAARRPGRRRALAVRSARRAGSSGRYYAKGLGRELTTKPVPIWAQAIAFKIFVTLLPLIVLAMGVFGLVLRQSDPFATVAGFLRTFLPPDQGEQLVALVFQLQKSSGTLTLVGVVALVVTVVTLFSTLRYVVGAAVSGESFVQRSVLRGYLFDARMALQAGSLALLSVGLTLGTGALLAEGGEWAVRLGMDPRLADAAGRLTIRVLALVVPYLLTVGVLVQLYLFVPRPRPPLASAAVGAGVAAVLFELAKNAFAVYARTLGNFGRYDAAGEGLAGLGGVFGLLLAFVFWVYVSGFLLIVGAAVTRLHEARHDPERAARRDAGQISTARGRFSTFVRSRLGRGKAKAPADSEPEPRAPAPPLPARPENTHAVGTQPPAQ